MDLTKKMVIISLIINFIVCFGIQLVKYFLGEELQLELAFAIFTGLSLGVLIRYVVQVRDEKKKSILKS